MNELIIKRPDDWHLHLRDGDMLQAVLPFSAQLYGRAIIMPNLRPPVRTAEDAQAYRQRIMNCLPPGHGFQPLMTLYLTDDTPPAEIRLAKTEGLLTGMKLYPVGATTNSEQGVTDIRKIYGVLEVMQELDIPLLIHGEISDPAVDIFDREAVFIERELEPLRRDMPQLRIVMEHVSSKIGVDYILDAKRNLGATITPHHLLINRNSIFAGGLNPHMYCLPVVKQEADRLAIRTAALSGDPRFFFGSDSAPHRTVDKEKAGGAAGVFNIVTALPAIVQMFEAEGSMENLEAFMSLNGARFYGLPPNPDTVTLKKAETPIPAADYIPVGGDRVNVFQTQESLFWLVIDGLRQPKR